MTNTTDGDERREAGAPIGRRVRWRNLRARCRLARDGGRVTDDYRNTPWRYHLDDSATEDVTAADEVGRGDPRAGWTADEDPPDPLTADAVFEVLMNSRRRETLTYLERVGGESTIGSLAEHIAAGENGIPRNALNSTQRKRVYISLHQSHLPKMDDLEVIDFDKHRGTVRLRSTAAALFPHLRLEEARLTLGPDELSVQSPNEGS